MVKIGLSSGTAQQYTNGQTEVHVEARNVRQMVQALEDKYPGLGKEIQTTMSVAIDGTILPDPFLEEVTDTSEIYVLPKIGGG
ncbi:MAG: MoaD/ThiS family protein [Rhodospirillaceae bacterium]|mgnify:CR=1 FL=1|jgi:sulfur-carrier protein|nr:MoaD/ThiS family protein [Rhodospirillaceae bacterium]MBT4489043.1 MoaD/ThiS family protein [Rhodospirillaceae bacterium]MBT5194669.1 MoaD/ThiS family protein [Rhodospirillaceae bacterium]MBT5894604.1 MoaD/ThiS family protein [Rhodospirillaceae bacterium]MBT7756116.1 MoaD/ThiS family protein [Rhodospirillaceae bacterium]